MTKFKRYLITGGYGFIGSCLVRKLLDDDNSYVSNIDKLTYASNLKAVENKREGYIHLEKDINDVEFLDKFIQEFNPDCIIHLAAESHVDRSIDSPGEFIKTNIVVNNKKLNKTNRIFLIIWVISFPLYRRIW